MESPVRLHLVQPDQPVVLVAEDDVSVQHIVRVTLERDGYFVLAAESAEEALLISRKTDLKIHLVLSDIHMPKMSGIELARIITKERVGIHVLLMSPSVEEHAHGYAILKKPLAPCRLIEIVRGLLPLSMKT